MRQPNYDKFPTVAVPAPHAHECWAGWNAITPAIRQAVAGKQAAQSRPIIVVMECYPGVIVEDIRERLQAALQPALTIDSQSAFKSEAEIDHLVAPDLGGNDPVFGYLSRLQLTDFLDSAKVEAVRGQIARVISGVVLIIGPAAALLATEPDLFLYADMPRWEGQLRQRRNEASNLGVSNRELKASLQYKRSFFIDWRVCDRLKQRTMARWDYLLDTTVRNEPKLITGAAHLAALQQAVTQPFRVVPFFDPGPWGGQWMKEVCDLDRSQINYAWCFDCVPEENSMLLEFAGDVRVEIPSINLVFNQPRALLGEPVYGRFGPEFPIRFDFLDTMGGGNLSFQVHPTTEFVQEHFGIHYTQDESYYMLDVGEDAVVYLGRKNTAQFPEMMAALESAQRGEGRFPDEQFVAQWPAKKHDHFLIPAGTLHCSGANGMVLEISATPYIFTFKLWDWGRMGLDGLPRPVNIARGREVIDWSRDEDYALTRLINRVTPLASGDGWREERTGLHEAEFIETRRHWFTQSVAHDTGGQRSGGVHVLNLVQGEEAVVESPSGAFAPFVVHYAETFIVPAAVGAYTIRPTGKATHAECATMKAFVRTQA